MTGRLAATLAVALAACGADPPAALRVGAVAYAESELGSLSDGARRDLAILTAFAAAMASGGGDELAARLARAELDSATLTRLEDEAALRAAGLTPDELRAAYEASPEYELVVRHLVVLVPEVAPAARETAARARAVVALNRIRAGEAFADVAAEISEEPGAAERGGLLEPGRRGDWVEPFWEAAAGLEEGEVSGIVRTPYGYHVLRLEERRMVPLDEAMRDVAGRLVEDAAARQAGRARVDSLRADPIALRSALEDARRRGLGPTDAEIRRARGRAAAEIGGWASALGFGPDADAAAIKSAAMSALASDRQGAALARSALLARARSLELYDGSASSSSAVQAETSG